MRRRREPPRRILIVRLSHLGDVVCALGVFHALHEAYPRAEIAWVIQPEFAGLLEGMPGLSHTIRFERRAGWRAWPRVRAALRRFAPDLVVDAQGNLKSAAVSLCAGAPRRAGPARADWREPLGALVLNDPAPATAPGSPETPGARRAPHVLERMHVLARHVAPQASFPPATDVGLAADELREGEELLGRHAGRGSGGGVILHVSSGKDVRSWPIERWSELASALRDAGRPTLVLSGPAEAERGRELARRVPASPGLAHLSQSGLRQLAALFTAAARRGWRMVACDSGPMHLAWACGLRVTVLEGPQDAARTGPWPHDRHPVVRAADAPPCAPCLRRRCAHDEGPVCMSRIEAESVLATLD